MQEHFIFPNYNARYSDTEFDVLMDTADWQPGRIVRTEYYGGSSTVGSLYQDTIQPWFRVTAKTSVTDGRHVDKVGRTTGWTHGLVKETCTTALIAYPDKNRYIYCSHRADLYLNGGDSGSPVFASIDYDNSTAKAAGILFGKNTNGDMWFSPIKMIEDEMGAVDVCDPSCPGAL